MARSDSTGAEARIPVRIPHREIELDGDLTVPAHPRGLVVFAHGSGSGRHSPRNQHVAADLVSSGFATLLMDLLTQAEEDVDVETREHRFDIPLLAARVVSAIDWAEGVPEVAELPVIAFGASTGAAAALVAAAKRPDRVAGVISRGGRPDLAGDGLGAVRAPVLLVVGGNDLVVIQLNEDASRQLTAPVDIRIVPGATHLFEEPGTLDRVTDLALEALDRWLPAHA